MESLGERIRKARIKKGLSLRQLATLMDVKFNSISDWENNKNKPRKDNLLKIISQLNVEIEFKDFFDNEEVFIYEIIKATRYKWYLDMLKDFDNEELLIIRKFFKNLKK